MKPINCIILICTMIAIAPITSAGDYQSLWQRDTITDGFFGLNDQLNENGINIALGLTQIYQNNMRGGTSTHRKAGRYTGSCDIELEADFEKLLGIEGGSLYMLTEGSWSDGIDASSIAGVFGVNGDAVGNHFMYIGELWYEQSLWDDTLKLRFGKIDLTGGFDCSGCPVSFDGNAYANDETAQFLNSALINNPTIPFPDKTLALQFQYQPLDSWYIGAAAADAEPTVAAYSPQFNTAFKGSKDYFYIIETGITPAFDSPKGPLQGAYRLGIWYDPQPKGHSDATENKSGDTGLYLSLDQQLCRENSEPGDTQGLGTFFRYGYADPRKNDITHFWSLGLQYRGLFPGRDEDVFGFGFAHGTFSNAANTTYTDDYESVYELYYNAMLTNWASLTPSIQYVSNPGGVNSTPDAVVMGLRLQLTF